MPAQTSLTRLGRVRQIASSYAGSLPTVLAVSRADHGMLEVVGLNQAKILCELCLFFHQAYPAIEADQALRATVARFIGDSGDVLLDDGMLCRIERFPSAVHLVALVLLCAKTYGVELPAARALEKAIRSPAYFCAERMPCRYQEAVWLYEQITGAALPGQHDCSVSLLCRPAHPCVLTRDDLYGKTHTAMYETNFGAQRMREPFRSRVDECGIWHDLHSSFCSADWDLLCECMMTARFLDLELRSDACFRTALDSIFDRFGFVPSLTYRGDAEHRMSKADLPLYRFAHSYHTTLVYGLSLLANPVGATAPPPAEEAVEAGDVLNAIMTFFGEEEFAQGPLCRQWYADDVEFPLEPLVDGYATRCYALYGKQRALQFLDMIPNAATLDLVADTQAYIRAL